MRTDDLIAWGGPGPLRQAARPQHSVLGLSVCVGNGKLCARTVRGKAVPCGVRAQLPSGELLWREMGNCCHEGPGDQPLRTPTVHTDSLIQPLLSTCCVPGLIAHHRLHPKPAAVCTHGETEPTLTDQMHACVLFLSLNITSASSRNLRFPPLS